MGRLITYDSIVEEQFCKISASKNFQTGLIIGQCTDQKDLVLRLCPTPEKDCPTCGGDAETKSTLTNSQPEVDEQWLCQHAKQLQRTLPGGLDILGLYIAASSDYTTKNQSSLRQVLLAVYKCLGKRQYFCSKERVLLTICTVSSKIVCRTLDVSDYKCSATPAEWKQRPGIVSWNRLRSQLAVDIKFPICSEDAGLSLQKQIEKALAPFFENVHNAAAVINGLQRDLDEFLDSSYDSKKSKKKHTQKDMKSEAEWHDVDLLISLDDEANSNSETVECVCMFAFKGSAHCRAYVHERATVQDAINALKQDVVRSITARCEIHCEDLLIIDEEHKDPTVVHELPRRVFAPLPQRDICVCDFQFHSDSPADSLDALKELLNLDVTCEDIDNSCETSPARSTLILPESAEDRLSEFGDSPMHHSANTKNYLPLIGLIVAILIGIFAYVMSRYFKLW